MSINSEAAVGAARQGPTPLARLRQMMAGEGEHAGAPLRAGFAFGIRVASAAVMFVTQILLARWMGSHDFGKYVYAWTLVIAIGDLIPLGFAFSAQRIIPEYRHGGEGALLRGFLSASRLFVFAAGTVAALVAVGLVRVFAGSLAESDPVVLTIAAAALPAYALGNLLDGIARSYDRVHLALVPPFLVRPLLVILLVAAAHGLGLTTDAAQAMTAAVASTWAVMLGQLLLVDRALARSVEPGPRDYRFAGWLSVSLQIFAAWAFMTLFTYADLIVLNAFVTPEKVAIYYASVKTLALTQFITYAVSSVFGHTFVQYKVAGDQAGLERLLALAVRLTFWTSLAMTGVLLAFGHQILGLFGPDFAAGTPLLFILSLGLMARAAVGPAERLLTMLGEQRATAAIYAAAFATNLSAALVLVPPFGLPGAAAAVAGAMVVESVLLCLTVRRRLGLNAFVLAPRNRRGAEPAFR
ncbi:lipopolysaccharide biosynthesis protein [Prosthecomicrobium sp. N25]|uniref:lipopolysaccharide biosynthesis protein n=1 Tax=Prosthecomicrobium sp. N25 TaxID=3129254 RepID=UPI003077EA93